MFITEEGERNDEEGETNVAHYNVVCETNCEKKIAGIELVLLLSSSSSSSDSRNSKTRSFSGIFSTRGSKVQGFFAFPTGCPDDAL